MEYYLSFSEIYVVHLKVVSIYREQSAARVDLSTTSRIVRQQMERLSTILASLYSVQVGLAISPIFEPDFYS